MSQGSSAGLAGIVVGETKLSTVGKQGSGLTYCGYSIDELAEQSGFEEVAYLLLQGELPTAGDLEDFKNRLASQRELPAALCAALEQLPADTHPMDVLRTGCSVLGCVEPECRDNPLRDVERLLATFPSMLCYWHHFHQSGSRIATTTEASTIAGHFLSLLHGEPPSATHERAVDVSLVLYAEHEFNASTFAARVTTSTLADLHSAITSAIGTLRGPLHGGANEAAMELIEQFSTADEAEAGVMELLAQKAKIMGFGHRVYRDNDPRSNIIKRWAKTLSDEVGDDRLFPIAERIEQVMRREKNLFPNLDFFAAVAYHHLGIPTPFFTPIFVFSRTAGWAAHILEQRANNRLIRPSADYTGPDLRSYTPMAGR